MSSAGPNNILLISPESGFGGSEKSFARLSKILSRHFSVFIVLFGNHTNPTYPLEGKIIYLNTPAAKTILHSIYNILLRTKKIRAIKNKLDIKTSISFLEGANYLNILTKRREKCIISIRGSIIHDPNIKGFGKIIRKGLLIPLLYKRADRVICISKGLKEEIVRSFNLGNSKISIIHNSINCHEIEEYSKESLDIKYEELFNDFTLVSHSRLSYEKGIQYQLIILSRLIKKFPKVKLILIGDGPFMDNLINYCDELRLEYFIRRSNSTNLSDSQVIFWGYTSNPFKLIRKADIFISTSLTEGFGNSILEAMACRCPVISSDCPYGPREIILPENDLSDKILPEYPLCHENGILMPVINHFGDKESIDLWVTTIEDLIRNRVAGLSTEAAYDRACDFDNKSLEDKWINLINGNQA